MTGQQWISISDYAHQYSVSDMTVRRRIRSGKLRAILKDGKYYIEVNSSAHNLFNETADNIFSTTTPPDNAKSITTLSANSSEQSTQQHTFLTPTNATNIEQAIKKLSQQLEHLNTKIDTLNKLYQNNLSNGHNSNLIKQLKRQIEDLESLNKVLEDSHSH